MKGERSMVWIFWGIVALVIIYFVYQMMPVEGVENITTDELKNKLRNKNIQFVDVRTPMEYNHHRIKQFKNIPLPVLRKECVKLDQEKEVVLICRSGSRSLRAARILKKAGFTNIKNVIGGMNHWQP